jgi:alkylhydroperoxidase family enzyme
MDADELPTMLLHSFRRADASEKDRLRAPRVALGSHPLDDWAELRALADAGRVDVRLRCQIGLALCGSQACARCRARTFEHAVDLAIDSAEIARNRAGGSDDARVRAALDFARAVARSRGDVDDALLALPRRAGFGDEVIAEIVALVTLQLLEESVSHGAACAGRRARASR